MFASKDTLLTRPSGYNIARSVRLRSSASAYFDRTPSVTSNQKTWTWSGWVKRGSLSVSGDIFGTVYTSGGTNDQTYLRLESNDKIGFVIYDTAGGYSALFATTSVYRDPSAWYHIVLALDTTQATSTNRVKLYVNGIQVTSFTSSTYPTQNKDGYVNLSGRKVGIGNTPPTGATYFDGYLTEINFIDGQALTPSSFGETDSITGVWKPKAYSGTYGTNGFELNFSDNSNNTAATIGKDYSGNGNNWTPNNISVTAGATYDSMVDSPTVGATSSNYCVINPLMKYGSNLTWANGNLQVNKTSSSTQDHTYGTVGVSSGKWYWEMTVTSISGPGNTYIYYGIGRGLDLTAAYDNTAIWYTSDGTKTNRATASYNQAYGASYTAGDVIAVALDLDAGTITFYKNNTSQGVAYSNLSTYPGLYMAYIGFDGTSVTSTIEYNFGQRPFSYTPPTGFVALNTYNLPASTIKNGAAYMAATTYTGNVTARNISNAVNGVSFQPDLVWLKNRTTAYGHVLQDSIRGTSVYLASNSTAADTAASLVTAFNSDGFAVSTSNVVNENSAGIVGWQWKAGGTSASNTNGSITSTVSVGATQGFSVVTYTGTGANATVGHGLGVAPQMIIIKQRSTTTSWAVYHIGLTSAAYVINLNLTSGQAGPNTVFWNSTAPTSTVFSLGTGTDANASGATAVAYCFAPVAGYSAFGSFVGNGTQGAGPFVYTGFRPRYVLIKNINGAYDWHCYDSSRSPYNYSGSNILKPNASDAELTARNDVQIDFLSNGFRLIGNDIGINQNGSTHIYMAFAETAFKFANAR